MYWFCFENGKFVDNSGEEPVYTTLEEFEDHYKNVGPTFHWSDEAKIMAKLLWD